VWLIPVSEARDLKDSAKPLEWRYSRIDLWLEAVYSETEGDGQWLVLRTDLLFVCLRGGTLLVATKERGGVVFALAVVAVVAVVGCVSRRLSSGVVVVRFGLEVLQSNPHVYRENTPDLRRPPLLSHLAFSHHLSPLKIWPFSPQWSPVTARSLPSQARLPLNPQVGASGGITQSPPPPESLAPPPSSPTMSNLLGMATRTSLLTLTGRAVRALSAKIRSIGRVLCQLGTPGAVSLFFFYINIRFTPSPTIPLIAFRNKLAGTSTPRTLNSLSAIAGHEGEEEDWEREMRDLNRGDDEVSAATRFRQTVTVLPLFHLTKYPVSLFCHVSQSDHFPKPFPGPLIRFGLHLRYARTGVTDKSFPDPRLYTWWLRCHPPLSAPITIRSHTSRIQALNVLMICEALPRL
jgi:hypothetical protein